MKPDNTTSCFDSYRAFYGPLDYNVEGGHPRYLEREDLGVSGGSWSSGTGVSEVGSGVTPSGCATSWLSFNSICRICNSIKNSEACIF